MAELVKIEASAIRRVSFYVAPGPVECCDRCAAGIRYVYIVEYRDGETQKYGSECINRILDARPTLKALFAKNAKTIKKYQEWLAILSGPVSSMPRGSEYFGSGLYFIGDSAGKDIMGNGHWFFHPEFDRDKNASGRNYIVRDEAKRTAECLADIEKGKIWFASEIARIEAFLAKVLRNGGASAANLQSQS